MLLKTNPQARLVNTVALAAVVTELVTRLNFRQHARLPVADLRLNHQACDKQQICDKISRAGQHCRPKASR
jgi:hypothetical protein